VRAVPGHDTRDTRFARLTSGGFTCALFSSRSGTVLARRAFCPMKTMRLGASARSRSRKNLPSVSNEIPTSEMDLTWRHKSDTFDATTARASAQEMAAHT